MKCFGLADQKVIHSSLSTDSSCLEPASRCDVTEKRSLSNRKSNFSDQDGTFFQSGSSVVTNDHSLLQSSISIDSGCPFTTNGSTSLMESSMQSSLMSDCFSMADSSSSPSFLNHQLNQDSMIINRSSSVSFCSSLSRPPCVALPPQFHDSELNLNQSKSFDFAPHYDQAALDHKRFVHHLDHSRLSIDQGEEQVLMVDEFGAVHQFTSQPFTLRSADEPQSIVRVPPPSYQSFLESRNDLRNLLPNDATRTGTRRIERRNNNIRSLVSNHASAQYNHENSASQHRVAAKQFATVSEGASATLGDDDNYQNRHTNNGSKRVEAKQEQLRRVMEFVLVSSSGLSSRNRTPIAGRSSALGGRSLFKGLQQSSRVRSGVANEAWVPCATDQFTRHMQGNPMSPTSSNAPNIDLLLQRQKQLHLQLKALARDCCSLTPNASATNNRCQQSKSIGSTLGANCVTSNSSDDVLIRSNDAESKQTLKNDAAGHNDSSGHSALTSQADSGIAELHCNDSGHTSDTSSPSFDQSPAVSASHNCSQNSKGDLATRIEQLRAELQSVVKVAIDQIRHIQSSSPSVSSVSSASLSCSSSSN